MDLPLSNDSPWVDYSGCAPSNASALIIGKSKPKSKSKARAAAKAKARTKTATNRAARHQAEAAASAERNALDPTPNFSQDEFGDFSEEDAAADAARSFPYKLDANYREWNEEQRGEVMDAIVHELRRHCAREGTSPGDATSLYVPSGSSDDGVRHGTDSKSWFSGATSVTAFFLDSFLYSVEEMHRLIDEGRLDIFYCSECDRTVQGDSRKKKEEKRLEEEQQRIQLIRQMRLNYRNERRARQKAAKAAAVSASPSSPSHTPAASSSSASSSFFSSALSTLSNSFSFLSTSGKGEDGDESDDDTAVNPTDAQEDLLARNALAAAVEALPPISPFRFPRHDLQPKYCPYCRAPSHRLTVRTHLTHSLSVKQLNDMYESLILPHIDFDQTIGRGKKKSAAASSSTSATPFALDIGSRLGNQLYMGLLRTSCPLWIGVELDSFFVKQSKRIVRKWGMDSHIRIIEDDIANQSDLLQRAKLVCFFNSFELHVTREKHRELLQYLRDSISQTNQYILSCPSLEDIYTRAESEVQLRDWVELVAEKDDAFIYRVK